MITTHTQLIQSLIDKYGLQSYLEIGVQSTAQNFDKINCMIKQGVDPSCEWRNDIANETSDSFFERYYSRVNNRRVFDVCFIDGLHTKEQVKKDFENCLKQLPDNGFILIHDVLPENEAGTKVPRETKQWWGDVWKFAFTIAGYGYEYKTFNIDNGCLLLQKKPIAWDGDEYRNMPTVVDYDWQAYLECRHRKLRITDAVTV